MEDNKEILLELLQEILGDEKRHYESSCQISYDCVICDEGNHKGNLEVNYGKFLFKCWSCSDVNNMQGSLGKLIDKFGTKKQKTSIHSNIEEAEIRWDYIINLPN